MWDLTVDTLSAEVSMEVAYYKLFMAQPTNYL